MSLDERVAIVTGGGKGIGKHYCQGLAAQGAAVVVAEIDPAAAETDRPASYGRQGTAR